MKSACAGVRCFKLCHLYGVIQRFQRQHGSCGCLVCHVAAGELLSDCRVAACRKALLLGLPESQLPCSVAQNLFLTGMVHRNLGGDGSLDVK